MVHISKSNYVVSLNIPTIPNPNVLSYFIFLNTHEYTEYRSLTIEGNNVPSSGIIFGFGYDVCVVYSMEYGLTLNFLVNEMPFKQTPNSIGKS